MEMSTLLIVMEEQQSCHFSLQLLLHALSFLLVLPTISTNQPLSHGTPASSSHKIISSQSQKCQQQAGGDQGSKGPPRMDLVNLSAFLLVGFYPKLKGKNKIGLNQRSIKTPVKNANSRNDTLLKVIRHVLLHTAYVF